jgi:hypothetical protein
MAMVWRQSNTCISTNMRRTKKVGSGHDISNFFLRADQFESQQGTDYPN